jgi:endonuclease YncB( thermonuclease family)
MPYTYNAIVQRVIDGDTLVANVDLGFGLMRMAQSFRILGINAREHSMPGGREAAANLATLLPFGTAIVLASVKDDKYGGRYDARITLPDGRDLSGLLVAAEWAAPWDGQGVKPVPAWPRSGSVA